MLTVAAPWETPASRRDIPRITERCMVIGYWRPKVREVAQGVMKVSRCVWSCLRPTSRRAKHLAEGCFSYTQFFLSVPQLPGYCFFPIPRCVTVYLTLSPHSPESRVCYSDGWSRALMSGRWPDSAIATKELAIQVHPWNSSPGTLCILGSLVTAPIIRGDNPR